MKHSHGEMQTQKEMGMGKGGKLPKHADPAEHSKSTGSVDMAKHEHKRGETSCHPIGQKMMG